MRHHKQALRVAARALAFLSILPISAWADPIGRLSDDPTLVIPVQTFAAVNNSLNAKPTDMCKADASVKDTTLARPVAELLQARNTAMIQREIVVPPGSCDRINHAIASLSKGGTVRLLEGDYDCASPVIMDRSDVALIGAGRNKTRIRAIPGKALPLVIIGDVNNSDLKNGVPYPKKTTKNIVLGGMSIDGNYHSNDNAKNLECWNPKNNESLDCADDGGAFIRNNGLTIRRSEDVIVRDIDTSRNYSGGIVPEKLNKRILMDGFSASDNFFDGFAGYETTDSTFRNFNLHHNTWSGVSVDLSFHGNIFENGSASDNGDNGIFSHAVKNNVYRHMVVEDNRNLAFFITGDSGNDANGEAPGTCDGNEINDVKIRSRKTGIDVNYACKGIKINRVQITQASMQCTNLASRGQFEVKDTTCSDGFQTKAIDPKIGQ